MTTIDIEALRALVDAATEGPWFMETMRHVYVGNRADGRTSGLWSIVHASDDALEDLTEAARDRVLNDAAFIAAARTAVPALLDALAEREGEVERLRAEVEHQRKILAKRLDIVRDLTAAHDGVVRDLMAIHRIAAEQRSRAAAAEAKVRAVEALHRPDDHGPGRCDDDECETWCVWCVDGWPCATARALATPEPTVQHATNVPRIVAEEWANEADAVYDDEPTVQAWPQEDS